MLSIFEVFTSKQPSTEHNKAPSMHFHTPHFPKPKRDDVSIWMSDAWNPEDSAHPRKMIFSIFRYQRAFLIYNAVRRSHKRSFSTEFPSRDKVVGEQQSKGFFVPFKFHNRCVRLSGVYLVCSWVTRGVGWRTFRGILQPPARRLDKPKSLNYSFSFCRSIKLEIQTPTPKQAIRKWAKNQFCSLSRWRLCSWCR